MTSLLNPANLIVTQVAQWPFSSESLEEVSNPPQESPEAVIPASPPARPKRTRKPAQSIAPADFVGPPLPPPEFKLPEIKVSDTTPLNYTLGIELTAMPDLDEKERSSFGGDMASYQARIVRDMLRFKRQGFNNVHRDINAVEVSSDILKTWGAVRKFYDNVTDAFDRVNLKSHVEDTISGGGHIHVGGVKPDHMANTLRDLQNRPYLNWIFNDPDDKSTTTYASDIASMDAKLKKLAPRVDVEVLEAFGELNKEGQSAILFYGNPTHIQAEWFPDDKSKMARVKRQLNSHTLEFRFFQTPLDWSEQQAQLEFVLRYINWTHQTYKDNPATVEVDTTAKVKAFTEEQSVLEFKKLLRELKLPEAPYERMLKDNLPDWFLRGRRM